MLKILFVTAAALMISTGAALAQYQGVAANDHATFGAEAFAPSKSAAEAAARATCYKGSGGEACKAISNPASYSFAIIKCVDDGPHVHMASSPNGGAAAIASARSIARGFGRTDCTVLTIR